MQKKLLTTGSVFKTTAYIAAFNQELEESDESKRLLRDSMADSLRVFKFPSVERGTYDRLECAAINKEEAPWESRKADPGR